MNVRDFNKGVEAGREGFLADLMEESDKGMVILALFRKASDLADKATDPLKKAELKAYAEGFRIASNILSYHGNALEAVDRSYGVTLTEEEKDLLGETGH
jgi:hypothetical protein